jgi:hypothetical protein
MSMTRVKMNLSEGSIELEGTEAFVTRYLDEFKVLIVDGRVKQAEPEKGVIKRAPVSKQKAKAKQVENTDKPERKQKKGAPKVTAEKLNLHGGSNTPSLKDFFEEKKPGRANGDQIAVIGYYITELLGNKTFSEGQVEYAYKMLKLKRPGHLHQIMINNKIEKDYYEQDDETTASWSLTRTGEIYVNDQLPAVTK